MRQASVDRDQVLLAMEPSKSMSMPVSSKSNNPNWFLKEKPQEELRSQTTLTRAAGNEPFIVGSSLARYSKELDRSSGYRPSSANRYGRSPSSASDWKRGSLPVLSPSRSEAPHGAEERMVRLGMIPPRSSYDANGHIPMGYMTAPHPARAKSPKKDRKRKSKELEESRRYNGEVLVPVKEVELWQYENTPNPPPFALPKEDYNTEGATWYRSRSLDGQDLLSSSVSYNYPRHGPSSPRSPTGVNAMLEEYHGAQTPERLKRVQRVGVPILPD